jgi:alanine dehydrogenase
MPGAVAQTSTWALTNTTIRYAERIAEEGVLAAIEHDEALALGVNAYGGHVTYRPVAEAHGMPYRPLRELMRSSSAPAPVGRSVR